MHVKMAWCSVAQEEDEAPEAKATSPEEVVIWAGGRRGHRILRHDTQSPSNLPAQLGVSEQFGGIRMVYLFSNTVAPFSKAFVQFD